MPATPGQRIMLFGLWRTAAPILANGAPWSKDEDAQRRHEFTKQILGTEKSWSELNRRSDVDLLKVALLRVINPPGSARGPRAGFGRRAETTLPSSYEARRRRTYFALRGAMRRLRLDEKYVNGISKRMFLGLEIGQLAADELQKLIIALKLHEERHAA
jgi:hypothetical protein